MSDIEKHRAERKRRLAIRDRWLARKLRNISPDVRAKYIAACTTNYTIEITPTNDLILILERAEQIISAMSVKRQTYPQHESFDCDFFEVAAYSTMMDLDAARNLRRQLAGDARLTDGGIFYRVGAAIEGIYPKLREIEYSTQQKLSAAGCGDPPSVAQFAEWYQAIEAQYGAELRQLVDGLRAAASLPINDPFHTAKWFKKHTLIKSQLLRDAVRNGRDLRRQPGASSRTPEYSYNDAAKLFPHLVSKPRQQK